MSLEDTVRRRGFQLVAGIDEVGRGPLAGPVVAAAVVLPAGLELPGVKDSKLLTAARREACSQMILDCALGVALGSVGPSEIDRTNILQATFQAMVQAVAALSVSPDYLLIDGPYRIPLTIDQEGIPGGDRQCLSIAAASIVAKVYRDRLMCDYHRQYPEYGFDRNKGYGTAEHLEALRRHGPCPIHRVSFRRVVC